MRRYTCVYPSRVLGKTRNKTKLEKSLYPGMHISKNDPRNQGFHVGWENNNTFMQKDEVWLWGIFCQILHLFWDKLTH